MRIPVMTVALKNCADPGGTATVLQVSTTCDQGRTALGALASKGARLPPHPASTATGLPATPSG